MQSFYFYGSSKLGFCETDQKVVGCSDPQNRGKHTASAVLE